jgi:hypothetical protein
MNVADILCVGSNARRFHGFPLSAYDTDRLDARGKKRDHSTRAAMPHLEIGPGD